MDTVKIPKYRKSYRSNIYVEPKPIPVQIFEPDDIVINIEKVGSSYLYCSEVFDTGKKCGGLNHLYLENFI